MINHIHIFGASGAGTTTLGRDLAEALDWPLFDADNYYWLPTSPPFQAKRPKEKRLHLLREDLAKSERWVLSGSICNWCEAITPLFDLTIFLAIPSNIRLERLAKRETITFGAENIRPDGKMHDHFNDFMDWAAQYESGGMGVRSRVLHETWMQTLPCPVLRIEGDFSRQKRLELVLEELEQLGDEERQE